MTERSIEHGGFVVERVYNASPDRVFAAWSDPQAKARWFDGPEAEFEVDFRVGGWERRRGVLPDGREYAFESLYRDIVPGRRIVYAYMLLDGIRISVSVATAVFKPERDGTRLVFTEQGAFLDGHEIPARREQGMGSLLDSLRQWLQSSRSDGAERPTGRPRLQEPTTSSRNYERNGTSTLRQENQRMARAIGRVHRDATPSDP